MIEHFTSQHLQSYILIRKVYNILNFSIFKVGCIFIFTRIDLYIIY